jgi:hypothetical protein
MSIEEFTHLVQKNISPPWGMQFLRWKKGNRLKKGKEYDKIIRKS